MRAAGNTSEILSESKGFLYITVGHCLACGRVTLAPVGDTCGCGNEMYPVSRNVPLGEPLDLEDMKGG